MRTTLHKGEECKKGYIICAQAHRQISVSVRHNKKKNTKISKFKDSKK